jgi:predicted PolB exonuclease-like 3'-5' exonuclease
MKMQRNSPSNVKTGWNQKFFYKVESDGMLDNLIRLFAENGNDWSMKKETFDKIVAKNKIDQYFSFASVRDEVLEVEGDNIRFQEYVAESLLAHSWRWSSRNTLKNLTRMFYQQLAKWKKH